MIQDHCSFCVWARVVLCLIFKIAFGLFDSCILVKWPLIFWTGVIELLVFLINCFKHKHCSQSESQRHSTGGHHKGQRPGTQKNHMANGKARGYHNCQTPQCPTVNTTMWVVSNIKQRLPPEKHRLTIILREAYGNLRLCNEFVQKVIETTHNWHLASQSQIRMVYTYGTFRLSFDIVCT